MASLIWEDIQELIQTLADNVDAVGAYGLRHPGDDIEIQRDVTITPGKSWGSDKPFEIYLKGIGAYFQDKKIDQIETIYDKVNEVITSLNQLISDYNSATVPTTADEVDPLP